MGLTGLAGLGLGMVLERIGNLFYTLTNRNIITL